ncbi:MAG: tetratricopeptide repeat protein [Verrucomicrobiia bacterium]
MLKLRQFIPLLVVAVGLLAYHNSFTAPFIFDDVTSIVKNPTIRRLWPIWGPLLPPHEGGSTVEGRPVLNFSLALNYAVGGVTPWGYHALNLAIHILAGLTLFGITRRTLLRPALCGRFGAEATSLALAVAGIWTVHPLQTEAVTYVAQRAESLMGLLYLLTLYGFIRGVESLKSGWWYALSVTACLLGMGTKEVMVSAPLIVLAYDGLFVAGRVQQAWRKRWRLYTGLASTWLPLGWLVANTGTRGGSAGLGGVVGWWEYALTQCRAIVRYLRLSVWPDPLVFDYGTTTIPHLGQALPYALILAALAAGTMIALWRHRPIGFLGLWFFAILAPSSSVVPVITQTMAEHRMYLPLAAVVTMAVVGAFALGKRLLGAWPRLGRLVAWGMVGVVVLWLAVLTIQRNFDYSSELRIWQDTVAKCPDNPRVHYNLGVVLGQAGKIDDAIGHYEQALRIKPDDVKTHCNLGIALRQEGKIDDAIGQYEQALRIKPDYADAHNNLGTALRQEGKIDDAIEQYEQALRIDPDFADAHYNLGTVLGRAGRIPEAIEHLQEALRIEPNFAEAHCNLGIALGQVGKIEDAIGHYEQALRIKPDYADAHYNLGIALGQAGRIPEAIEHLQQALRIKPNFTQAQNALARLQARQ